MPPGPGRGQERPSLARRFRSVIFWLHLAAGVVAGAVILVMSATGVLLMYERQVLEWADRNAPGHQVALPSPGTPRLPVEILIGKASGKPSSVTVQADPTAPVAVSLGRERTVYVHPYTGQVLGEGAPKVRAFFHGVTDWHRTLGAEGERRDLGRAITGACNLAFLILVVSGLYLWLPRHRRHWSWAQVSNVLWFRRGLPGKARDFNWHNVIGFWSWGPLFLIVLTGVVLSYSWAGNLLYRMVGEEPPPARQGPPGGGGRGGGREEGPVELAGLNGLWAVAERQVPGWRSITMRLPGSPEDPVTFSILQGHRGRPDLRSSLSLDRATGEAVKWEPYASQSTGRRLRTWSRWVHTGEAGGVIGQTVAGLVSAGAVVLVWTGIALAWRRFFHFLPGGLRKRAVLRPAGPAVSIQGESQQEELS